VGTVRILYRASTVSLQAAVHPKHMLGVLNMKEEERYRCVPTFRGKVWSLYSVRQLG